LDQPTARAVDDEQHRARRRVGVLEEERLGARLPHRAGAHRVSLGHAGHRHRRTGGDVLHDGERESFTRPVVVDISEMGVPGSTTGASHVSPPISMPPSMGSMMPASTPASSSTVPPALPPANPPAVPPD
jgi:hypothetical protein